MAKKSDLEQLNEKFNSTANKVDKMDSRIEALKIAVENVQCGQASRSSTPGPSNGRRNTGSRTTASSSHDDDDWRPKVIHLRGWAPFGCAAAQKLQKQEAIDTYNFIPTLVDAEPQEALSPTPPFLLNHCLGYRCDPVYNIYSIAEKFGRFHSEQNFTIKGAAVRARCEQSPERRRMWQRLQHQAAHRRGQVGKV